MFVYVEDKYMFDIFGYSNRTACHEIVYSYIVYPINVLSIENNVRLSEAVL